MNDLFIHFCDKPNCAHTVDYSIFAENQTYHHSISAENPIVLWITQLM